MSTTGGWKGWPLRPETTWAVTFAMNCGDMMSTVGGGPMYVRMILFPLGSTLAVVVQGPFVCTYKPAIGQPRVVLTPHPGVGPNGNRILPVNSPLDTSIMVQ